ncbi:MAG: hypothetical protein WCG27_13465, partial [Pseudomonadota bacterium]
MKKKSEKLYFNKDFAVGKLMVTVPIDNTIERMKRYSLQETLWPLLWGQNCCSLEWQNSLTDAYGGNAAVHFLPRCSPRQSDLMIITGPINEKSIPVLMETYNQMPGPKWIMVLGSCAGSGAPFLG